MSGSIHDVFCVVKKPSVSLKDCPRPIYDDQPSHCGRNPCNQNRLPAWFDSLRVRRKEKENEFFWHNRPKNIFYNKQVICHFVREGGVWNFEFSVWHTFCMAPSPRYIVKRRSQYEKNSGSHWLVDVYNRRTHDLLLTLYILRNYAFISFISQWEVKLSYYRVLGGDSLN